MNHPTADDSQAADGHHDPAPAGRAPRLTAVFRPSCIEMVRKGTGKSSVISLLVRSLMREERIDRAHAEEIISGLMERERYGSSAIGKGLAFPHLRTRSVDHFVGAIGVAPEGIPFGSLDQQPTHFVFLTLSPWDEREEHVLLLSRLVSLMGDKAITLQLREGMRPQQVYEYLSDLDRQNGADDE